MLQSHGLILATMLECQNVRLMVPENWAQWIGFLPRHQSIKIKELGKLEDEE